MTTRTSTPACPAPEPDFVWFLENELDAIVESERIFNLEVDGDPTAFAPGHFLIDTHAYEGEEFWLTFHAPDVDPESDDVLVPYAISWQTFNSSSTQGTGCPAATRSAEIPVERYTEVLAAARAWTSQIHALYRTTTK